MSRKIEQINDVANRCGYFFNAYLENEISANNGYNCKHPKQEETYELKGQKIGMCHCWSCPLGYEADEEDFENTEIDNQGFEYGESEFLIIED